MAANPAEIARYINTLGAFCGPRDVAELTPSALRARFGFARADVMALFGGSVLAGGDVLAQAMRAGVARTYVIVGGAGHTTETLRRVVRSEHPELATENLPEAEIFQAYLRRVYGLGADALETESTNCGNNITYLLRLLEARGIRHDSVILCQDATMQRRMDAGLRKYAPAGTVIVNYAAYRAEIVAEGGALAYRVPIHGMWDIDRYVNLLMGEIPRLAPEGYGPEGQGFIARVDIPEHVSRAFAALQKVYGAETRAANPLYATGRGHDAP